MLRSLLLAREHRGEPQSRRPALRLPVRWRCRQLLPAAGTYTKERLARLFNAMLGRLKGGLRMTLKGAVAEGDKLALEAESYGELTNGRVYNQHYHFLIEFRDGRICAVRE